ncbi:hypothetical protein [Haloplanus halophilus]|nr:hypothetical protein [Haloplanus sp. GDY1]
MTHTDPRPDDDTGVDCEAFRHPNGWFLIREIDSDEGWLCTDRPVDVER